MTFRFGKPLKLKFLGNFNFLERISLQYLDDEKGHQITMMKFLYEPVVQ